MYIHIPSNRQCDKMTFFEQDYIVFKDTKEMKPVTKEGLYSKYTLKEILE